jgi:hypothetical protein
MSPKRIQRPAEVLKRIAQTTRIVNSNTTMNVPPRAGSATTEVDSTGAIRRAGPAQEIADFTDFARIVAGDDEAAGEAGGSKHGVGLMRLSFSA